jgi:hypothetical protein
VSSGTASVLPLPLVEAEAGVDLIGFSVGRPLTFVDCFNDVVDGCFVMAVVFELEIWPGFVIRVGGASFFSFEGGLTLGTSTVTFLFFALSSSTTYFKSWISIALV